MQFSQIIGQSAVKEHFLRSVNEQRISHAQLIAGQEGVGTLPLAIAYAQYICCTNRTAADSCGTCPSCRKFAKLAHPDLHFVFPVIKTGSKTVVCDEFLPQWREQFAETSYFSLSHWLERIGAENKQGMIYSNESEEILRKLSLKTYESEYKVMVVWLPEKMHETCANKLLKILEEPPEKTVFLLITEQPDQLLATIISRTQRINVPAIALGELQNALVERFGINPTEARNIARIANGDYIKAVEIVRSSEENARNLNRFASLMRGAYAAKPALLKKWADDTAGIGRERQKDFLAYTQRMVRENFILNLCQPELNYLTADEAAFSSRFAPFINERNVEELAAELALAERHVEQNGNPKMVFFDLALKIIVLLKK